MYYQLPSISRGLKIKIDEINKPCSRVEAGYNTATVAMRVTEGDEKENLCGWG
jgi:hypothetical protein